MGGGQADEPVVQSEETNEVAEVAATSTSAEVCVDVYLSGIFLLATRGSEICFGKTTELRTGVQ